MFKFMALNMTGNRKVNIIDRQHCFDRGDFYRTGLFAANYTGIRVGFLKVKAYNVRRSHILHTGCPRRNVPDFRRVFLMLKYTDITQNTYVQIWTVTEIMAREKSGLLAGPTHTTCQLTIISLPPFSVASHYAKSARDKWLHMGFVVPSGWYVVQFTAALWMVGRLSVTSC